MQMVEGAAALDRNAHAAEGVVADCRRYTVGDLLLILGEEGVGRRIPARLLDPHAFGGVPVTLEQVALVVLHLLEPVLGVPHQRLLVSQPLVCAWSCCRWRRSRSGRNRQCGRRRGKGRCRRSRSSGR